MPLVFNASGVTSLFYLESPTKIDINWELKMTAEEIESEYQMNPWIYFLSCFNPLKCPKIYFLKKPSTNNTRKQEIILSKTPTFWKVPGKLQQLELRTVKMPGDQNMLRKK